MPKARNMTATFKESIKQIVIRVLQESKANVLLLGLVVIAVVISSLLPPQLLRLLIDRNLNTGERQGLGFFAGMYLLAIVLNGALDFTKGVMLTKLGQKTIHIARSRMLTKLSRIPLRFFSENGTGSITSRFTTDVESMNSLFANGIVSMVIDSLKIVGILISMAMFSFSLAGITLLVLPLLFLITRSFQRKMLKAQMANLNQLSRVGNHITESISNIQMIKLFSREIYMEERYDIRLRENYNTRREVNIFDSVYAPIIQLMRAIIITLMVLAGSSHVNILGISVGMLAAAIELLSNLLAPIEALGMEFQNIQQGISGIARVDEFLKLEEEQKSEQLTAKEIIHSTAGIQEAGIRFEHVSFYYEKGQEVIHDISFEAKAGESVVLSGRTGVGKTTMINLILGFLVPQQGQIYVNQTLASDIPDTEKRKLYGYVEQKFQFVPGNVLQQITLGDVRITKQQVEEICQFVGLHNYIQQLEDGYDTPIISGSEFSFGQRQLLSIARAIVTNPPILLLDEMTANLDSETEERVVQVLEKACENRTIINISHRAGAINERSRVIHIENGRVV